MDLQTVIWQPSSPHTHTVVFLHGRGDNAHNFAASLRYSPTSQNLTLQQKFPSFRWVFPQSEIREWALNGIKKPQWFDVWNTNDFKDREELQAVGLRESVSSIKKILASEAEMLGGKWENLILAGISQGGATSIHTLINLSLPSESKGLGAFLGFSCRMPFPNLSLAETRKVLGIYDGKEGDERVLRNTYILLEHCVDDPLVKVEWGRDLRDSLKGFEAKIAWREYQDGGHWFNSPQGMDDVVAFIETVVLGKGDTGRKETGMGDEMDLS